MESSRRANRLGLNNIAKNMQKTCKQMLYCLVWMRDSLTSSLRLHARPTSPRVLYHPCICAENAQSGLTRGDVKKKKKIIIILFEHISAI